MRRNSEIDSLDQFSSVFEDDKTMTAASHRPRLRSGLAAARDAASPTHFVLWDSRRITHRMVRLAEHEIAWCQLFDGHSDLRTMQQRAMRQNGGQIIAVEHFVGLMERLDEALLLDSERFYDYLSGPIREPSCIGCYDRNPEKARQQLSKVFTAPGGPGLPEKPPPRQSSIRALLVPHMDYTRGNVTYGWGYRELFDRTAAELFVIIGTSHFSPARFSLTRQNFQTPFGVIETDQAYVDRIAKYYGDEVFEDPVAHLPEHSIELEVVLLQFLYEQSHPFRIVPLLVGSFHDAVMERNDPSNDNDISRMVQALQHAEAEASEEVCYIISGDLAHIGPKFEDPVPVNDAQLQLSRKQDEKLIRDAEATNMSGYFDTIAKEKDSRRICGLPPTWMTLAAAKPSRGKLLHYQQFVHPEGFESVSFASMAFDK